MKKVLGIILSIVILLGLGYFFRKDLFNFYIRLEKKLPKIEKVSNQLFNNIEKQISAPPPLRNNEAVSQSPLTEIGIITWTNNQRQQNGNLPPLAENTKLNEAALIKAQDMFARQYFEHVSPSGVGPSDLADEVGYAYIAFGENLALGNFKDDQSLVQAWMDSPGHRANILSNSYQEIGVAVIQGIYEGSSVWIAVQEFGLPLSACPQPDAALNNQINAYNQQVISIQQQIDAKLIEIENTQFTSREQYKEAISQYNDLINQYNSVANEIKGLIKTYNDQVNSFNACASG